MTTVTPAYHVPTRQRDPWQEYADACVTGQHGATPPVALAKRARHRKPGRRRDVITKVAGTLALAAAIVASASAAGTGGTTPAFYGMTPQQAVTSDRVSVKP